MTHRCGQTFYKQRLILSQRPSTIMACGQCTTSKAESISDKPSQTNQAHTSIVLSCLQESEQDTH